MRSTGGIGQHAAVRAHESSGLLHPAVSAIRSTERWHSQTVARAEKVACSPSDDRCYSLPYPLEEVRASCSPKGRFVSGVPAGSSSPTRGATAGMSGSMCTPARVACGARRSQAVVIVGCSESGFLSPHSSTEARGRCARVPEAGIVLCCPDRSVDAGDGRCPRCQ